MAYDNGPLLGTCAAAATSLDEPFLAAIVDGIIAHYPDVAPDLVAEGGFPASQDADFGFDNDGDYWTWTIDELRGALADDDDFELARIAFGLDDDGGRMHIDRSRHVLFRALDDAAIASRLGIEAGEANSRLDSVREHLKAVRDERPAPYVDMTLYSGWVALVAAGHLRAGRYLGREAAGAAGLRALDRIWRDAFGGDSGVRHRAGDAESAVVLEDQAYLLDASLDAFEFTQDMRWLDRAASLVPVLERRFREGSTGALRDRPPGDAATRSLEEPLYPITDSPTPSGNGAAALALMRLSALGGNEAAAALGTGILRAFAGVSPRLLAAGPTYAKAVAWAVSPVTTVVVVDDVESPADSALFRAALRSYRPRTVTRFFRPDAVGDAPLPDAMRAMVEGVHPRGYVCAGRTCAAPVADAVAFGSLLRTFHGD
jgi:uncharacterized protein YyaL (SSP411 family)